MSKVKNYYWDQAEKAVDAILLELKNNAITKEAAKAKIAEDIKSQEEARSEQSDELEKAASAIAGAIRGKWRGKQH